MRQAIIWTSAEPINRHIYATQGGDEIGDKIKGPRLVYFRLRRKKHISKDFALS